MATTTETRDRHILLAKLHSGEVVRVGRPWMTWDAAQVRWSMLDDARRAGRLANVHYLMVRSWDDPNFQDVRPATADEIAETPADHFGKPIRVGMKVHVRPEARTFARGGVVVKVGRSNVTIAYRPVKRNSHGYEPVYYTSVVRACDLNANGPCTDIARKHANVDLDKYNARRTP